MHETDDQLILRVLDSDTKAFRLLFEEYQPVLFRSILHSVRDTDLAHDVVQETFVRVWNHRSSLKPGLSFLAYLFRISANLVRDAAKHSEVRRRLKSDVPLSSPSTGDDPAETLQLNMLEETLSTLVRTKLPDKCRQIFLLSRMEGLPNAEIGRLLGVSVKTVENQLTKALKILRRHLGRYLP